MGLRNENFPLPPVVAICPLLCYKFLTLKGTHMADEKVLVIQRSVMDEVGSWHGLNFHVDKYLPRLFAPGAPRFMPRPAAEKDPSHKQLIPYVLMSCGDRYLTYVRGKRAGETRLVGHRSMGIGGHINPVDDEVPLFGWLEAYTSAVKREVEEEVTVTATHTDKLVALINDDSTEVGSVHLGVVHLWKLSEPNVTRKEQMITQMEFMTLPELLAVRGEMETWSQLCLDYLASI
jgi:predicted NUDIX family phosphoesterase